jgi:hypothetical protein
MSGFIKDTLRKILPPKKTAALPPSGTATPPGAGTKPGPDPAPTEALLAWHRPLKNLRLLIAYRAGTDPTNPNNLVSVNVRNNVNFLPHMKLRVARVSATVYDLVGPLPRWRGRW